MASEIEYGDVGTVAQGGDAESAPQDWLVTVRKAAERIRKLNADAAQPLYALAVEEADK